MKFKRYIKLNEAAYVANIGFEELVKFYRVASNSEIDEMEDIIEKGNWDLFKRLIRKVLGVVLL